jgi:hypothetical protein
LSHESIGGKIMNLTKRMTLIGCILSTVASIVALTLTATYKLTTWQMFFDTATIVLVSTAVIVTVITSLFSWMVYMNLEKNTIKHWRGFLTILGFLGFWQLGAGFFFLLATLTKNKSIALQNKQ